MISERLGLFAAKATIQRQKKEWRNLHSQILNLCCDYFCVGTSTTCSVSVASSA